MNVVNSCKSWLPRGAVDAAFVDRALAGTIRAWSEKWLARGELRPLGPFAPGPAGKNTSGESLRWHVLPEGIALGVADKATGALAGAMLDTPLGGAALTSRDRALIERLTAAALDDLRGELLTFFRVPAEARWRTGEEAETPQAADAWACAFGMKEREPLIRLIVQHDRIVAFRKSRVRSPADPVGLRPLADALERQRVGLSARLGQCAMTLSDLAALSEGDVLVLDRALDAPLELAVDWSVKSGRCTLEQEDERLLLKISKPLQGEEARV